MKVLLTLTAFLFITTSAICQTHVKMTLQQPERFEVYPSTVTLPLEEGEMLELGMEAEIYGGSGNYFFTWSLNGVELAVTPTLMVNVDGYYLLTIQDGEGCETTISYKIGDATAIGKETIYAINIYPNPTDGVLHIESDELNEFSQLAIYTLEGQLILAEQNLSAGEKQKTIDLTSLTAGQYLLVLKSESKKVTRIITRK